MQNEKDICDRCFRFALRVIRVCQVLDEKPGVGRALGKQLIRSGTSIGANMEEAQAGQSRADFISKVSIAQKEARETHYWLRLIAESSILPANKLDELQQEADELCRIIASIVVSARASQ